MQKPQTFMGYTASHTERVERVLLEVWSHLGAFHEHLVLVGGLAPRYLVQQSSPGIPPHCGTVDVDLGVSLAVTKLNVYTNIRETLERIGFRPGENDRGNEQRHSFVLPDPLGPVVVDFLTTNYDGPQETVRAVQRQLSAIQVEGLGLALRDPLSVSIKGRSVSGGLVETIVRVARPIPFVVLKALSFSARREGKDVNDLIYVLRHSAGEVSQLARSVQEAERNEPAFIHAIEALTNDFQSPVHDGPERYRRFLAGQPDAAVQAFATVQEFLQQVNT